MCFFVYLLINAHRFNSPLLHFFFTHTHKHDKAETLSLQICVCVFASPQLVTSGPSSPDRVCTGTSTASDILPWLATGEFPPCCHARGHFSRVWKLQHKYWTTEIQSCKYPSVHDALFAGTFLTFLDFFLQCPLSFGDTERLSGLSHFPEISQFCCVDCFGTHLFISVLNLVSVFCHVFCWESCCSHLLHPADIWMFPQLLFLHPLFIDTVYTCTLLPPEIYLYLPPFFESVYLYLTRIVKLVFPSSCCGFYKNLNQREKKGHQRTTKSSGLFIGL